MFIKCSHHKKKSCAALMMLILSWGISQRSLGKSNDFKELIEGWFAHENLPPVQYDPRLSQVAKENSIALSELSNPVQGMSAYLGYLLESHHIYDAVVQATATQFSTHRDLEKKILHFLAERATGGGYTHFGFNFVHLGSKSMATLILVRRVVSHISIQTAHKRTLTICARIHPQRKPKMLITSPKGRIFQKTPAARGKKLCASFPKGRPGRYQIEILTEDEYGPEVAALFPLYLGIPSPLHPIHKLYPPESFRRQDISAEIFSLINQSRKTHGLKPLRRSFSLSKIAQAHSEDMRDNGFFGHTSPAFGDLAQRLSSSGIKYFNASENLALSSSPKQAHESLMNSPSHRQTLLDPHLTDVGIGIAIDHRQKLFYLTQCFIQALP